MSLNNADEKLYEVVMNDIPKNPVNIAGNILVCNRGCNLHWTLGEIDGFTIVRNGAHLLLKKLTYKEKPISSMQNKYVVTFNGGANSYGDKSYVLSSIAINFPSIVYHGGALASGDIMLTCKAVDNSNLTLVLIIPTETDQGHHESDMTAKDIAFFTKIVNNIPSKLENNHKKVTDVNDFSIDMLLPKKETSSSKDHSFFSFVSPENSNICYIYFQHTTEVTDTLLNAVVGQKGTTAYNNYLTKANEKWTHPNPDNMVIFGNRDIPSETMSEIEKSLGSGNVKCNVHADGSYVGGDLKEGKTGDGVAVPITGRSENVVNIYLEEKDDSKSGKEKKSEKKGKMRKGDKLGGEQGEMITVEKGEEGKEGEDAVVQGNGDSGDRPWYKKAWVWIVIVLCLASVVFGLGFLFNRYKNDPTSFIGRAALAVGLVKAAHKPTSANYNALVPGLNPTNDKEARPTGDLTKNYNVAPFNFNANNANYVNNPNNANNTNNVNNVNNANKPTITPPPEPVNNSNTNLAAAIGISTEGAEEALVK